MIRKPLTRDQLYKIFGSHEAVKAFEDLFNKSLEINPELIELAILLASISRKSINDKTKDKDFSALLTKTQDNFDTNDYVNLFKKIDPEENIIRSNKNIAYTLDSYTPTITDLANISSTSVVGVNFFTYGNYSRVFGRISIEPTASATLTQFRISLPTYTNIINVYDLSGFGSDVNSILRIFGDTANDEAFAEFVSTGTSTTTFDFSYEYRN